MFVRPLLKKVHHIYGHCGFPLFILRLEVKDLCGHPLMFLLVFEGVQVAVLIENFLLRGEMA